jgi:hypothetical protein
VLARFTLLSTQPLVIRNNVALSYLAGMSCHLC